MRSVTVRAKASDSKVSTVMFSSTQTSLQSPARSCWTRARKAPSTSLSANSPGIRVRLCSGLPIAPNQLLDLGSTARLGFLDFPKQLLEFLVVCVESCLDFGRISLADTFQDRHVVAQHFQVVLVNVIDCRLGLFGG